jgi:H+/Cl- antiporter ClcA
MPLAISLLLSVVFGLFGAAIASLIFFQEYRQHGLSRRRVWREALSAGVFAFVVLVVFAMAATYLLLQSLR